MSIRSTRFALAVLATASLPLFAANPLLGTWKLNVAKSTFAGAPKPQSNVCTYTDAGGGAVKFVGVMVDAQGKRIERSWVSKRDGQDVPFKSETSDAINLTVSADGYSGAWFVKSAGKVVSEGKSVISKDGKVMTWNWKGTNAEGKPASGTSVFEKQ